MYTVIGANCDGAHLLGRADTLAEAKQLADQGQAYSDSIGNQWGTTYVVYQGERVRYRTRSSVK